MPRLVRFLSCTVTGLLLALVGFFVVVYLYEDGARAHYWQSLISFTGSPVFWLLTGVFGLLMASALVLARVLVRFYPLSDGLAGLIGGLAAALCYAVFLVATHAREWGDWASVWSKAWPAGFFFALPLALSGGFAAWMWRRFD
ncbi:MAG TPA: hypothetical protein VNT75_33130 [Symbiobacteriaceae bacterium]|nr:hypothetical protein [Symbiobacteriaceae bacterium]